MNSPKLLIFSQIANCFLHFLKTHLTRTTGNILSNIPNHSDYVNFNGIDCFNEQNCLLLAAANVAGTVEHHILRTTDGGQTWTKDSLNWAPTAFSSSYVTALNYRNPNLAYAAYAKGLLLKYEVPTTGVPEPDPLLVTESPNPVDNQFTVTVVPPANGMFILLNSLGQVVMNQQLSGGSTAIQRSSLPAGVYSYLVLDQSNNVLGNGQLLFL